MGSPTWLAGVFAAMMLAVAAFCAGRLLLARGVRRARRPAELDSNLVNLLMGVAMAGMLATALRIGTPALWITLFGLGAAWFGAQALRLRGGAALTPWQCARPIPHLLECGAMLYMLLALPTPHPSTLHPSIPMATASMPAADTSHSALSAISLLLAVVLTAHVVWQANALTPRPAPASTFAPASPFPPASAPAATPTAACARVLAPRCAICCKIAMGITMAYMLVLML